jgi:hypothetical protein
MQSATALCCREVASAEFILLVAPAWQNRLPVVRAVLEDAGATVTAVDPESAIMRGRVQTDRLDLLTGLPQVTSLAWRRLANPEM